MAKSIPLKKFRKFLKSIGLVKIRTIDSHELYDNPANPLLRPVTVDTNYSDVPLLHIHTNLKTIGMTKKEFEERLREL